MQPKTLKTLGVVFLVLMASWGLTLLASRRPEPKEKFLWDKAKDAKRLVIGDTVLVKAGSDWHLEKPFAARADRSKVEEFLGKLAEVMLSDAMSNDPARQEYFMVTPSRGVRLQGFLDEKAASPALDILVGKSGSEYDSVLLRQPNQDDVVEGRGLARYDFEQGASRWADRTLAKIEASSVRSIELRSSTETLRLNRIEGRWRLNDAKIALSTAVASEVVEPMLARLGGLDADEVLQESAASSTTLKGLRNPQLTIIVRYADGVASGAAKVLGKTVELAVAPKGGDSRCAVRKRGDKLIYMVSGWALDAFRRKASDFKAAKAAG